MNRRSYALMLLMGVLLWPSLGLCALKERAVGPMPAAWTQAFQAIKDDRPPKAIVRNIHYIISNENRHFLFKDAVQDRGGVYMGVGTDQNYLMAGWSRPEVLVLMDFDQVVVDVHRVYRLLFLKAADAQSFMDLWGQAAEPEVKAMIDAAYPDAAQRGQVRMAYRIARSAVHNRLRRVRWLYKRLQIPMFLTDEAQYTYLRDMFRNNRVYMARGDLTADVTVKGIAAAARAAGVPVRVVYLSNAERYFGYNREFKDSVLGLPMDGEAQVLRTWGFTKGRYRYNVQGGQNFHAWLRNDKTTSVKSMLRYVEEDRGAALRDLSVIRTTPEKLAAAERRIGLAPAPPPGRRYASNHLTRGSAYLHLAP